MWTEIKDQIEIENLMEKFGDFHDSCIRDIYISTEEFVDKEHSMCFENVLTVSLLFQRQSRENSVLELKFEAVKGMDYGQWFKDGSTMTYEATLEMENDLFYWVNDFNLEISAKRVFWRFRPELVGNVRRINED